MQFFCIKQILNIAEGAESLRKSDVFQSNDFFAWCHTSILTPYTPASAQECVGCQRVFTGVCRVSESLIYCKAMTFLHGVIYVFAHPTHIHMFSHPTHLYIFSHPTHTHIFSHLTNIHVFSHPAHIHIFSHPTHIHMFFFYHIYHKYILSLSYVYSLGVIYIFSHPTHLHVHERVQGARKSSQKCAECQKV